MNTDPWHTAETLDDLAHATIQFLRGNLHETPNHGGPANDETAGIREHLIAMNSQGFVTTDSQPGVSDPTTGTFQRAYVEGFCTLTTAERMRRRTTGTELVTMEFETHEESNASICVTVNHWREFTWLGRYGPDELDRYIDCNPTKLRDALSDVFWLQIFDPAWGVNSRLWHTLTDALHSD